MMDDDEMQQLRRRFGDDVEAWPAPYRQAALGTGADPLDALLFDAVQMPTDEAALARALNARLEPVRAAGWSFDAGRWLSPAMVSACAAVAFVLASLSGYAVASGERADGLDISVLRLATGGAIADDFGFEALAGDDTL